MKEDSEEKLVLTLSKNGKPIIEGLKFRIDVLNPGPRLIEKHELVFDDHVARSLCWESVPRPRADKVTLKNCFFRRAKL